MTAIAPQLVDELGRLEIWRGGGLTSAMALLAQGPTPVFPHALAVVRDYLLDDTEALLAEAWPDRCRISPDDNVLPMIPPGRSIKDMIVEG